MREGVGIYEKKLSEKNIFDEAPNCQCDFAFYDNLYAKGECG